MSIIGRALGAAAAASLLTVSSLASASQPVRPGDAKISVATASQVSGVRTGDRVGFPRKKADSAVAAASAPFIFLGIGAVVIAAVVLFSGSDASPD